MSKDRAQLKSIFVTGHVPTQDDFAQLIDSAYNTTEDGPSLTKGASTTEPGLAEKATLAEVESGSDESRFVTPKGAKRAAETHAPVLSVNGEIGNVIISSLLVKELTIPLATGYSNNPSGPDRSGNWQGLKVHQVGGQVILSGLVTAGGGRGTLLTLPVGVRPSATLLFQVPSATSNYSVTIYANGKVDSDVPDGEWISLSGVQFIVSQSEDDGK